MYQCKYCPIGNKNVRVLAQHVEDEHWDEDKKDDFLTKLADKAEIPLTSLFDVVAEDEDDPDNEKGDFSDYENDFDDDYTTEKSYL